MIRPEAIAEGADRPDEEGVETMGEGCSDLEDVVNKLGNTVRAMGLNQNPATYEGNGCKIDRVQKVRDAARPKSYDGPFYDGPVRNAKNPKGVLGW